MELVIYYFLFFYSWISFFIFILFYFCFQHSLCLTDILMVNMSQLYPELVVFLQIVCWFSNILATAAEQMGAQIFFTDRAPSGCTEFGLSGRWYYMVIMYRGEAIVLQFEHETIATVVMKVTNMNPMTIVIGAHNYYHIINYCLLMNVVWKLLH